MVAGSHHHCLLLLGFAPAWWCFHFDNSGRCRLIVLEECLCGSGVVQTACVLCFWAPACLWRAYGSRSLL